MNSSSEQQNNKVAWTPQIGFVAIAIVLNMSGAIIGKYIALSIDTRLSLAVGLAALLLLNHLCRVFFWVAAGRRLQLSYIYPILSVNYPLAFMLGLFMFGESFEWNRFLGSIIIVLGVVSVTLSSNQLEQTGTP
ncbi:MAG: hypothetical protein VCD00_20910 [Candidatus Hydrogenedentota bacterium]